jgi:hypothetical protein
MCFIFKTKILLCIVFLEILSSNNCRCIPRNQKNVIIIFWISYFLLLLELYNIYTCIYFYRSVKAGLTVDANAHRTIHTWILKEPRGKRFFTETDELGYLADSVITTFLIRKMDFYCRARKYFKKFSSRL